jgi:acetyltransferase-like isoleucine patch superfamily enzyme
MKKQVKDISGAKENVESKTQLQSSLMDPDNSALKKYQNLVLGTNSIFSLIKFELVTLMLSQLPGALGLVLRKIFYKRLFRRFGKNVIIGRSVTIRHPGKISIDDNVIIDDYSVLDAKGSNNEGIIIGKDVMIGRNSVISCKDGNIIIGDSCNIAMNCFIQSAKNVTIGKNVLFSAYCYVIGGGDHKTERTDIPIIAQGQIVRGVIIQDNVLIGANVMIQDGVKRGRDCIVGTGAVVTKSINEFSVAAGVPAKIIRNRK